MRALLILIGIMVLLLGAGSVNAYLENYTVLSSYPDGQPMHIVWDGPETIYSRQSDESPYPDLCPCRFERIEGWYNEYGQLTMMRYLDRTGYDKDGDGKNDILNIMPSGKDALIESTYPIDMFYVDKNGVVVNYLPDSNPNEWRTWIHSNKTPRSPIKYPPGFDGYKAMQVLNLTKAEFVNSTSYELLKQAAYKRSPEYMAQRIEELEQARKKENVSGLRLLVETNQQRLDIIKTFISDMFNKSLW